MSTTAKETIDKERKLRLEASMQMRAVYEEKQKRWKEFRESERQRRIDKANAEELNRLNRIIAESRARREYSNSKFQHSSIIRSHYQAAVTIQRAFRKMISGKITEVRMLQHQQLIARRGREKAAIVIQRWWRKYWRCRVYKLLNFQSIMTGPVVALGNRTVSPSGVCSYAKVTSITGLSISVDIDKGGR